MLLDFDQGLTDKDSAAARQASMTHAGMAHFAGTGPAGHTCRECEFWRHRKSWFRERDLGAGGEPHDAPCAKARQLLMRRNTPPVPHSAPCCRHFSLSDHPQPLKRPEKRVEQEPSR